MSETALLAVDMFNTYRHPDADKLADNVAEIVEPLSGLISRAKNCDDVDLIYVNDNHGDFAAGPAAIVRAALEGARPDLVRPLVPEDRCRFITKVRHSIFYASPLEYLLGRLGARQLILCGQVTEQCVLYSALDAYVRHFDVVIPTDAVAPIDPELGQSALEMMRRNMRATLRSSTQCLP
ncbi:isochorismatase family cysteine hydrolase [Mycobacteroides saopaulense]|uniref:Isochorismatase n=1 Tax=Mycobacteroides saopaulense TaxID=1578165 RepID=A0ABX3C1Y7_9MYCO|nr:isochorismatase family cysteine hydrolase [Mycobacteroides saopaulense]OHT82871.1 isochorismatase [Mycobacteroides saopaulense]OHU10414.1 isochorismatase [Mycobacteroides saopaulense]